jgi:hypothetical protein
LSRFARKTHYSKDTTASQLTIVPSIKVYIPMVFGLLLFSSSAFAEGGLKIVIDHCNDVDADEIAQIVAVDFLRANEGKSTITISCEGEVATLRMLEAGTTKELGRSVDLTGIDPVARPRTLAILVVELLESWEPNPEPAPAPIAQPRPVAKQAELKSTPSIPKAVQRPLLRQPTFAVDVGIGVGSRSFQYRPTPGAQNVPNLRPYDAPFAAMARLNAEVYPLSKTSPVAGLGLSGRYDAARTAKSRTSDNVSLDADRSYWDFNLRYQRVLRLAKIAAEIGLGRERYGFSSNSPGSSVLLGEVPDVRIQFTRLALDAEIPLTPTLGVDVDVEYRIVGKVGELAEKFVETQVIAWAAELGAHYWFADDLRARLIYCRGSYDYTFVGANGVTEATGDDTISSLIIGLSMHR